MQCVKRVILVSFSLQMFSIYSSQLTKVFSKPPPPPPFFFFFLLLRVGKCTKAALPMRSLSVGGGSVTAPPLSSPSLLTHAFFTGSHTICANHHKNNTHNPYIACIQSGTVLGTLQWYTLTKYTTIISPSQFVLTFSLIQPQLSLHQTHPGSCQHSTSSSHSCHSIKHILVHVNIQPHPATAITPSNTSWFTSTFNLIQPQLSLHQTHSGSHQDSTSDSVHIQPHPATTVILLHTSKTQSMSTFNLIQPQPSSVTHISDSVHADIQPHPHTGGHCTHPQAAHVQIQQPPHTGSHTIRHIHMQHTSKFNNLHIQAVTLSGTSTGSPCSQHTIKSCNHPNLCTGRRKEKKVPRNHINYHYSWNTTQKYHATILSLLEFPS